MRRLQIILAALLPVTSFAQTYLSENFANYIPSTFTVVDVDGGSMQPYIYQRMGDDLSAAWVAGQLANGYGRAALSPTRHSDPSKVSDHRMTLPAVEILDADAVIQWEARSLHRHCPESYRVAIRQSGTDSWSDIYVCDAESPDWTMHSVSLSAYVGAEVEIAFIATTCQGFILAVDNVFVGVPDNARYRFVSCTPHYVGDDGAVTVCGTLTCFGVSCPWTSVTLECGDASDSMALPALGCGDSAEIELKLYPSVGQRYDYSIKAVGDGIETVIYSDFVSCSYFPRTHIVDRGSGTWCPQCPPMELTTSRLERLYGDDMIVLETHINDQLVNRDYWRDYLEDRVYSIPCLIPNHDLSRNTASVKTSDNFSSKLHTETVAKIDVSASYTETGGIRAVSSTAFAMDIDNSDDRYRVAYMLIGDVHDGANGGYMQSLSVSNFNGDLYYYMPDNIMPEMMYFDNVPVSAEVAYRGVAASLPKAIKADGAMPHAYTLAYAPAADTGNVRVVAMVIDTTDGTVLNAAVSGIDDPTGIADISADCDGAAEYYDVCGRILSESAAGLVIVRQGASVKKVIKK